MHEAAAFCGIAVKTLAKIETAKSDVKLSSVLKVCLMLGIRLAVEPWEGIMTERLFARLNCPPRS